MKPEEILSHAPKALTKEQREFFFTNGYLKIDCFVSGRWLERLGAVTKAMVDRSRALTKSDAMFDLETEHTAEHPRLRRLTQPVEHDPTYWEFASNSPITDVAEDLLGPNVKFHHSKLNFKAEAGGVEVKWHQDFPFLPHTNSGMLTVGVYLEEVEANAPLGVVPGSHEGELFSHYNEKEEWVGAIQKRDFERAGIGKAVYLTGRAGTITVHSARAVHGSAQNESGSPRPLLLHMYTSGDAMPLTPNPLYSRYNFTMIRGRRPRRIEVDPRPIMLPPDFSAQEGGLFRIQYQ
jgi:ectoine hydroxylase